MTIKVDGTEYGITTRAIKRDWVFDYKYREPTEDGTMQAELRGVYFKYKLVFNAYTDHAEYALLINKLTEATEFHSVTVPSESGDITFSAYFDSVGDEIWIERSEQAYFKALTVTFTSRSPQRTP